MPHVVLLGVDAPAGTSPATPEQEVGWKHKMSCKVVSFSEFFLVFTRFLTHSAARVDSLGWFHQSTLTNNIFGRCG